MTNNKLEIAPMTVTIDRLTVGGKQMTKSVFNQIQNDDFYCSLIEENFDDNDCVTLKLKKDMLLGYVVLQSKGIEEKWYIWVDNGRLRKGVFGTSNITDGTAYSNELTEIINNHNRRDYFIHQDIRFILSTEEYEQSKITVSYRDIDTYIKTVNSELSFQDRKDWKTKSDKIFRQLNSVGYEFHIYPKLPESSKKMITKYMESAKEILDQINDMQLYIAI